MGAEDAEELHLFYDAQSRPAFVEYNGVKYRYIHNLQGDIVGIVDGNGTFVVEYRYDAWGKPLNITGSLADTLGRRNPFRYRGYVYDEESELYYLRSRYYRPDWNRLINADAYITTGSGQLQSNLFLYCNNTPNVLIDPDGTSILGAIALIATAAINYAIVKSGTLGYSSPESAAKAFSQSTYSQSRYIRHEYGTAIYSKKVLGSTRYYYNKPTAGTPHGVNIPISAPSGAKLVATAHTHPNSNEFSETDKNSAVKFAFDSYVVGPNLNVQKFNYATGDVTIVGTITLVELSKEQRVQLRAEFEASWYGHIASGDANGFDCSNMPWPTE